MTHPRKEGSVNTFLEVTSVLVALFVILTPIIWFVERSAARAQKRFEDHCNRVLERKDR